MDARCRIELLGGLRVIQGDRTITRFQTRKVEALVAYLAYDLRRPHAREALVDLLWPETDLTAGRHSLSQALSSLRHQLEPPGVPSGTLIQADRTAIRLNSAAVTTDVVEFEALLEMARAATPGEQARLLVDAVALYRGELLAGQYEEWIPPEQVRLADRYHQALRDLLALLEAAGDLDRALDVAHRAVAANPLREGAHRERMRLSAAAGQPEAALRQYQELERLLKEELGTTPDPATRLLAQKIQPQAAGGRVEEWKSGRVDERTRSVSSVHSSARPFRHSSTPLPTGTVTFLLTDIEGSTALWEQWGDAFKEALERHHRLLRAEFHRHGGHEVKEAGDSFLVAFQGAGDALACALACQRALLGSLPPAPGPASSSGDRGSRVLPPLRVRMVLHTGEVEQAEGEYRGLALHHAARMLQAGHGGQVLCSEVAAGLLRSLGVGAVAPGARLRDLGLYRLRDLPAPERLFQVDCPGMPEGPEAGRFPPLRADPVHVAGLPLQLSRFIGRQSEIEALVGLLGPGGRSVFGVRYSEQPCPNTEHRTPNADCRLVTLTGPGGTGKTRLAIEAAARLATLFHGNVTFVPLADLGDASLIPDAILTALRQPRAAGPSPLEQLVAALASQPSLLVLDNLEQLLGGRRKGEDGAEVVRELLERVPGLSCLVTSRQGLGLTGEREIPVSPLAVPGDGMGRAQAPPSAMPQQLLECESVALFVDRAQAVRPDFQLTTGNAAAVADLCTRLEGIPLAIELAASRAQVLTPGQMLAQLEQRFDFLVSRRRDMPERHRTLRAAVEWSYHLLDPDLQRFFAALSVFRGGWTLEAAEVVATGGSGKGAGEQGSKGARDRLSPAPLPPCSLAGPDMSTPALDLLEQLRECSLVLAEETQHGMRFRMLETLREFAAGQLATDERAALQERHAACFLQLAEEAEGELTGSDQPLWLSRLEAEHENLRAALSWIADCGLRIVRTRRGAEARVTAEKPLRSPNPQSAIRNPQSDCGSPAPSGASGRSGAT